MLFLFALAFLASTAHAAGPSSVEVAFANYGWEWVNEPSQPHNAVGLACFQWRLSHQWQGRRDTLAAAFSYKRIRLHEWYEHHHAPLFDIVSNTFEYYTTFYLGGLEVGWTRQWSRSWATQLRLMPSIVGEDFAGNWYPVWGEALVQYKGLGLGVGRLEVSGQLRWWPLVSVRHRWRGILFEGLFPRYGYVQKGLLKLSARLEGAVYPFEGQDWDSKQPFHFSHLDLGAALVVSQGWLTIDFELGRTIQRRFETAEYEYQSIDDGWYIRTNLRAAGR